MSLAISSVLRSFAYCTRRYVQRASAETSAAEVLGLSLLVTGVLLLVGCDSGGTGGSDDDIEVGAVEASRGGGQIAETGTALGEPLVTEVTSVSGEPGVGVEVTWTITDGDGSLSKQTSTTDAQGRAQISWTLEGKDGTHRVTAMAGGETVTFEAYADAGPNDKRVEVLYLVPSDREVNPTYKANLEKAIRNAQWFFRSQMGNGKTFTLAEEPVKVVETNHRASWYRTNENGRSGFYRWFYNAKNDVKALTDAHTGADHTVSVAVVDAVGGCYRQKAAGNIGLAILDGRRLASVAGQAYPDPCGEGSTALRRCNTVGTMAHELGHALGLKHSCEGNTSPCFNGSLMSVGLHNYPDTHLEVKSKNALNGVEGTHAIVDPSVVASHVSVETLSGERPSCDVVK